MLLHYVDRLLNTGATVIRVPADMARNASAEELEEARRLAKLNGARLKIDAGSRND